MPRTNNSPTLALTTPSPGAGSTHTSFEDTSLAQFDAMIALQVRAPVRLPPCPRHPAPAPATPPLTPRSGS